MHTQVGLVADGREQYANRLFVNSERDDIRSNAGGDATDGACDIVTARAGGGGVAALAANCNREAVDVEVLPQLCCAPEKINPLLFYLGVPRDLGCKRSGMVTGGHSGRIESEIFADFGRVGAFRIHKRKEAFRDVRCALFRRYGVDGPLAALILLSAQHQQQADDFAAKFGI